MNITDRLTMLNGDCLAVMREMPDASVDAVVCDPPYGLSAEPDMAEVMRHWMAGDDYTHSGSGFMGKSWDSFVPGPSVWREAMRVLKPGGHLAAFFGTRTYDIGTLAIRLAGFEIRDQLAWVYGSGFPKSLDVSKAIDKAAGAEREVIGTVRAGIARSARKGGEWVGSESFEELKQSPVTLPATPEAQRWAGWGTALKPAWEPICLARKPLIGTVAANVLQHGTGGINVDGCRVYRDPSDKSGWSETGSDESDNRAMSGKNYAREAKPDAAGRFPANLIHDGSDEILAEFPDSGGSGPARTLNRGQRTESDGWGMADELGALRDAGSGSAARFFYCAKASRADRQAGNDHPTVKPTALMQWLCRLVTPPGGLVLDPFMGSGSTGKAAHNEGFRFVGIERDPDYYCAAIARVADHVAR